MGFDGGEQEGEATVAYPLQKEGFRWRGTGRRGYSSVSAAKRRSEGFGLSTKSRSPQADGMAHIMGAYVIGELCW